MVTAPTGEEHAVETHSPGRGNRVLTLALARMATPDHQRDGSTGPSAGFGEGLDEQRHSFGSGEPPDVDEDCRVAIGSHEPVEVDLPVDQRTGDAALVGTLGILDQPMSKQGPALSGREVQRSEPIGLDAIGDVRHSFGGHTQHRDRAGPVRGRDDYEVIGGISLTAQTLDPELTVTPLRPASRAQHLELRLVEQVRVKSTQLDGFGHGRQGEPQGSGHLGPHRDRLDELDLSAVQMCHHRDIGPRAGDDIVLGGEVMKVEHLGPPGPSRREWRCPHRRQMTSQRRIDRGKHDIRRVVAVLERGVHRHRCRHRAAAGVERRHRRGVVQAVQLDVSEERRRVGALTRGAERPGHQRDRPTDVAERDRQITGHLRRPATRKNSRPINTRPRRTTATLRR